MKPAVKAIHDRTALKSDINIAKVEGIPYVRHPTYYKHVGTGQEYSHIAGAIGWPHGKEPGFIVIVGCEKKDPSIEPKFYVLDEFEHKSLFELLGKAEEMRVKWGYGQAPEHLEYFYADTERFYSLVSQRSISTQLYVSPPTDFEDHKSFSMYIQTLISCMHERDKRLFFGDHPRIVARLQAMKIGAAKHGNHEDYPAAFALGGLIHTLILSKPWRFPNPDYIDEELTYEEQQYIETAEEMGVEEW